MADSPKDFGHNLVLVRLRKGVQTLEYLLCSACHRSDDCIAVLPLPRAPAAGPNDIEFSGERSESAATRGVLVRQVARERRTERKMCADPKATVTKARRRDLVSTEQARRKTTGETARGTGMPAIWR